MDRFALTTQNHHEPYRSLEGQSIYESYTVGDVFGLTTIRETMGYDIL